MIHQYKVGKLRSVIHQKVGSVIHISIQKLVKKWISRFFLKLILRPIFTKKHIQGCKHSFSSKSILQNIQFKHFLKKPTFKGSKLGSKT